MNRLFVAYKPPFISSNDYLSKIKKRYKITKAGFSGTLDPFAKGVLVVAFNQYTKLFSYLKLEPKRYVATIWFGAKSLSFDTSNIIEIKSIPKLNEIDILNALNSLIGKISYIPPAYSAKWIDGKRAYELVREGKEVVLKEQTSIVYDIKPLVYNHPFFTFQIDISKGGYVRSIAELISKKLEVNATLSSLSRIFEGDFVYNDEIKLNPIDYLLPQKNRFFGDKKSFLLGKELRLEEFELKEDGKYVVVFDDFFSIVEIRDKKIKYLLNKVMLC